MKKLTIEESKRYQLDILKSIDKFCRVNSINYSLAYGTLLGAVRHKGFIPWDDDIDIVMLRPDYDRFVSSYSDERYKLIDGKDMANHLHVKISDCQTRLEFPKGSSDEFYYKGGVWVDVFPLDKVPEDNEEYQKLKKQITRRVLYEKFGARPTCHAKSSLKKKVAKRLLYYVFRPFRAVNGKKALSLLQKYNNSNSSKVASLSVWYLSHSSMPKEWFNDYCELEFEGHSFMAVKSYHEYLVSLFGDYMQLPPVEQRKPKHHFDVYLL